MPKCTRQGITPDCTRCVIPSQPGPEVDPLVQRIDATKTTPERWRCLTFRDTIEPWRGMETHRDAKSGKEGRESQ